jgi:chromate transporter
MITPAVGAVALLRAVGRRAEHPRVKGVVQAVILASAGLLWAAAVPIGRSAISDPLLAAILILSVAVLLTRKVEVLWVILGSAVVYLTAASFRLVGGF